MKAACPKCQENGHDQTGDNLHIYPDGHAHCFKCDYHVHKYEEGEGVRSPPKEDRMKVSEAMTLPILGLRHKPIPKNICERYGVRVEMDEHTGQQKNIYYPYPDNATQDTVAYKVKSPSPEGNRYTIIGDTKKATLFGLKQCRRGGKLLLVVEGEDDVLAAATMLEQRIGKAYNIVSVPNGANTNGTVDKKVKEQVEFFSSFETVCICLDTDAPGKATAKGLAHWLAPFTKVAVMELPMKDTAEMLIAGKTDEWYKCLTAMRDYKPDDIISGADIKIEDLQVPLKEGYSLPYPLLQEKLKGLREQELTLLTAGSGVGKSTVAREIAYHLVAEHGLKVGNIFLEETYTKTATSYIALDNNVPLPVLRVKPDSITPQQWEDSANKLLRSEKLYFTDHFGSLASENLIDKCRYLVHACGVNFIVLDHISMVISGQESNNERKDIDLLMTKLAAFVNESGVGVIAIVHLKRAQTGSYNEGKQIALSDLRGSGALEQLSWNVLAVERDQQDPENKNQSQIRVLKNREWGQLGLCDTLLFNTDTGRLLPLNTEEFDG